LCPSDKPAWPIGINSLACAIGRSFPVNDASRRNWHDHCDEP
jgi:hypothetical protein